MSRDVTNEVRRNANIYGGGGSGKPAGVAATKRLDLAKGNTWQDPIQENITVLPTTLNYRDAVGLFGAENTYIKINLNIQSLLLGETSFTEADGYDSAVLRRRVLTTDPNYVDGGTDFSLDLVIENNYQPATTDTTLRGLAEPITRVDLVNHGTGNIYTDNYLDVQIYGPDRQPIAGDSLFSSVYSYFYVGFHARRTKRLPYNVDVVIGNRFLSGLKLEPEFSRIRVS